MLNKRIINIPKDNVKMRGLGIPSFEDKVVQRVIKEILEAICVLHRTSKKKLKQKRQDIKKWLWEHMHESKKTQSGN